MRLHALHVENLRNITDIRLNIQNELLVVTGENGQGKTSLLESVWMLTGAKSFRGARDLELVRQGQPTGQVQGQVEGFGRKEQITLRVSGPDQPQKGRFADINGVSYGRASEIAGHFVCVVFYPDHLRLVKGSPEGRRRFMDTALCQLYPGYVATLRRYSRALAQKNALLKNYYKSYDAGEVLDAFDEELAFNGEEIIKKRKKFAENIGKIAVHYYSEITAQKEACEIGYTPCCAGDLKQALGAARQADIKAGFATLGPHREDLTIAINQRPAKAYASQGQQRSAVLCLKLAEAAHIRQVTGEHPVMLLDDVLSELDHTRKDYLLYRMEGVQCMITSCDDELGQKTRGDLVTIHGGSLQLT